MEQGNGSEAKSQQQLTDSVIPTKSHDDLAISSSKLSTTTQGQHMVLYKNFWLLPHHVDRIMMLQDSFKARQDDIILASNPKCGTTWLKALSFTITNRTRYSFIDHPLLTRHPHEVVPFLEISLVKNGDNNNFDTLASPRLLATHMPFSLLPKSIAHSQGCRIVYICREPKDAFISGWHFGNRINAFGNGFTDLVDAFNMFCDGFWPIGPFWDHCLEYWKESIVRPDGLLFLKYDEMMVEPVKFVRKLAAFHGVPFTNKEENNGVPDEVVRLCSFEKLNGLQASNHGSEPFVDGHHVIEKSAFFRRAVVGDWVNHMTEEMGRKIDMIMEDKLKGSGLVF